MGAGRARRGPASLSVGERASRWHAGQLRGLEIRACVSRSTQGEPRDRRWLRADLARRRLSRRPVYVRHLRHGRKHDRLAARLVRPRLLRNGSGRESARSRGRTGPPQIQRAGGLGEQPPPLDPWRRLDRRLRAGVVCGGRTQHPLRSTRADSAVQQRRPHELQARDRPRAPAGHGRSDAGRREGRGSSRHGGGAGRGRHGAIRLPARARRGTRGGAVREGDPVRAQLVDRRSFSSTASRRRRPLPREQAPRARQLCHRDHSQ